MKGGKRLGALLLAAVFSLTLGACEGNGGVPEESREVGNAGSSKGEASVGAEYSGENRERALSSPALSSGEESRTEEQEEEMLKLQVTAGGKEFSALLYDSETTRALLKNKPMTLEMNELNGNEKYFDLPVSLPAEARNPHSIRAGDLMLYGGSCLVLFYESFSTSYEYTPLGFLEDPAGLGEALGSGSAEVSFQVSAE